MTQVDLNLAFSMPGAAAPEAPHPEVPKEDIHYMQDFLGGQDFELAAGPVKAFDASSEPPAESPATNKEESPLKPLDTAADSNSQTREIDEPLLPNLQKEMEKALGEATKDSGVARDGGPRLIGPPIQIEESNTDPKAIHEPGETNTSTEMDKAVELEKAIEEITKESGVSIDGGPGIRNSGVAIDGGPSQKNAETGESNTDESKDAAPSPTESTEPAQDNLPDWFSAVPEWWNESGKGGSFDGSGFFSGFLGGHDTRLENRIKQLFGMIGDFSENCSLIRDDFKRIQCEAELMAIESLRRRLQPEAGLGSGAFGLGGGALGGTNIMIGPDFGNPLEGLPPIPNAFGTAPINVLHAQVTPRGDGTSWIDLNGTSQLWHPGADGKLGSSDDLLSELIVTNKNGESVHWHYDPKLGHPTRVENPSTGEVLEYDPETKSVQATFADGTRRVVEPGEPGHTHVIDFAKNGKTVVGRLNQETEVDGGARLQTNLNDEFQATDETRYVQSKALEDGWTLVTEYEDGTYSEDGVIRRYKVRVNEDGSLDIVTRVDADGNWLKGAQYLNHKVLEDGSLQIKSYVLNDKPEEGESQGKGDKEAVATDCKRTEAGACVVSSFVVRKVLADGSIELITYKLNKDQTDKDEDGTILRYLHFTESRLEEYYVNELGTDCDRSEGGACLVRSETIFEYDLETGRLLRSQTTTYEMDGTVTQYMEVTYQGVAGREEPVFIQKWSDREKTKLREELWLVYGEEAKFDLTRGTVEMEEIESGDGLLKHIRWVVYDEEGKIERYTIIRYKFEEGGLQVDLSYSWIPPREFDPRNPDWELLTGRNLLPGTLFSYGLKGNCSFDDASSPKTECGDGDPSTLDRVIVFGYTNGALTSKTESFFVQMKGEARQVWINSYLVVAGHDELISSIGKRGNEYGYIVFTQDGNLADAVTYDAEGNVTAVFWIDPRAQHIAWQQSFSSDALTYDEAGNLIGVDLMIEDPVTGELRRLAFTYDENGQVIGVGIENRNPEAESLLETLREERHKKLKKLGLRRKALLELPVPQGIGNSTTTKAATGVTDVREGNIRTITYTDRANGQARTLKIIYGTDGKKVLSIMADDGQGKYKEVFFGGFEYDAAEATFDEDGNLLTGVVRSSTYTEGELSAEALRNLSIEKVLEIPDADGRLNISVYSDKGLVFRRLHSGYETYRVDMIGRDQDGNLLNEGLKFIDIGEEVPINGITIFQESEGNFKVYDSGYGYALATGQVTVDEDGVVSGILKPRVYVFFEGRQLREEEVTVSIGSEEKKKKKRIPEGKTEAVVLPNGVEGEGEIWLNKKGNLTYVKNPFTGTEFCSVMKGGACQPSLDAPSFVIRYINNMPYAVRLDSGRTGANAYTILGEFDARVTLENPKGTIIRAFSKATSGPDKLEFDKDGNFVSGTLRFEVTYPPDMAGTAESGVTPMPGYGWVVFMNGGILAMRDPITFDTYLPFLIGADGMIEGTDFSVMSGGGLIYAGHDRYGRLVYYDESGNLMVDNPNGEDEPWTDRKKKTKTFDGSPRECSGGKKSGHCNGWAQYTIGGNPRWLPNFNAGVNISGQLPYLAARRGDQMILVYDEAGVNFAALGIDPKNLQPLQFVNYPPYGNVVLNGTKIIGRPPALNWEAGSVAGPYVAFISGKIIEIEKGPNEYSGDQLIRGGVEFTVYAAQARRTTYTLSRAFGEGEEKIRKKDLKKLKDDKQLIKETGCEANYRDGSCSTPGYRDNSVEWNLTLKPLKQQVYYDFGQFIPWKGQFAFPGVNVPDMVLEYEKGVLQAIVFTNLSFNGVSLGSEADDLYFPDNGFRIFLTREALEGSLQDAAAEYDEAGRLTRYTLTDPESGLARPVTITYDAAGNVTSLLFDGRNLATDQGFFIYFVASNYVDGIPHFFFSYVRQNGTKVRPNSCEPNVQSCYGGELFVDPRLAGSRSQQEVDQANGEIRNRESEGPLTVEALQALVESIRSGGAVSMETSNALFDLFVRAGGVRASLHIVNLDTEGRVAYRFDAFRYTAPDGIHIISGTDLRNPVYNEMGLLTGYSSLSRQMAIEKGKISLDLTTQVLRTVTYFDTAGRVVGFEEFSASSAAPDKLIHRTVGQIAYDIYGNQRFSVDQTFAIGIFGANFATEDLAGSFHFVSQALGIDGFFSAIELLTLIRENLGNSAFIAEIQDSLQRSQQGKLERRLEWEREWKRRLKKAKGKRERERLAEEMARERMELDRTLTAPGLEGRIGLIDFTLNRTQGIFNAQGRLAEQIFTSQRLFMTEENARKIADLILGGPENFVAYQHSWFDVPGPGGKLVNVTYSIGLELEGFETDAADIEVAKRLVFKSHYTVERVLKLNSLGQVTKAQAYKAPKAKKRGGNPTKWLYVKEDGGPVKREYDLAGRVRYTFQILSNGWAKSWTTYNSFGFVEKSVQQSFQKVDEGGWFMGKTTGWVMSFTVVKPTYSIDSIAVKEVKVESQIQNIDTTFGIGIIIIAIAALVLTIVTAGILAPLAAAAILAVTGIAVSVTVITAVMITLAAIYLVLTIATVLSNSEIMSQITAAFGMFMAAVTAFIGAFASIANTAVIAAAISSGTGLGSALGSFAVVALEVSMVQTAVNQLVAIAFGADVAMIFGIAVAAVTAAASVGSSAMNLFGQATNALMLFVNGLGSAGLATIQSAISNLTQAFVSYVTTGTFDWVRAFEAIGFAAAIGFILPFIMTALGAILPLNASPRAPPSGVPYGLTDVAENMTEFLGKMFLPTSQSGLAFYTSLASGLAGYFGEQNGLNGLLIAAAVAVVLAMFMPVLQPVRDSLGNPTEGKYEYQSGFEQFLKSFSASNLLEILSETYQEILKPLLQNILLPTIAYMLQETVRDGDGNFIGRRDTFWSLLVSQVGGAIVNHIGEALSQAARNSMVAGAKEYYEANPDKQTGKYLGVISNRDGEYNVYDNRVEVVRTVYDADGIAQKIGFEVTTLKEAYTLGDRLARDAATVALTTTSGVLEFNKLVSGYSSDPLLAPLLRPAGFMLDLFNALGAQIGKISGVGTRNPTGAVKFWDAKKNAALVSGFNISDGKGGIDGKKLGLFLGVETFNRPTPLDLTGVKSQSQLITYLRLDPLLGPLILQSGSVEINTFTLFGEPIFRSVIFVGLEASLVRDLRTPNLPPQLVDFKGNRYESEGYDGVTLPDGKMLGAVNIFRFKNGEGETVTIGFDEKDRIVFQVLGEIHGGGRVVYATDYVQGQSYQAVGNLGYVIRDLTGNEPMQFLDLKGNVSLDQGKSDVTLPDEKTAQAAHTFDLTTDENKILRMGVNENGQLVYQASGPQVLFAIDYATNRTYQFTGMDTYFIRSLKDSGPTELLDLQGTFYENQGRSARTFAGEESVEASHTFEIPNAQGEKETIGFDEKFQLVYLANSDGQITYAIDRALGRSFVLMPGFDKYAVLDLTTNQPVALVDLQGTFYENQGDSAVNLGGGKRLFAEHTFEVKDKNGKSFTLGLNDKFQIVYQASDGQILIAIDYEAGLQYSPEGLVGRFVIRELKSQKVVGVIAEDGRSFELDANELMAVRGKLESKEVVRIVGRGVKVDQVYVLRDKEGVVTEGIGFDSEGRLAEQHVWEKRYINNVEKSSALTLELVINYEKGEIIRRLGEDYLVMNKETGGLVNILDQRGRAFSKEQFKDTTPQDLSKEAREVIAQTLGRVAVSLVLRVDGQVIRQYGFDSQNQLIAMDLGPSRIDFRTEDGATWRIYKDRLNDKGEPVLLDENYAGKEFNGRTMTQHLFGLVRVEVANEKGKVTRLGISGVSSLLGITEESTKYGWYRFALGSGATLQYSSENRIVNFVNPNPDSSEGQSRWIYDYDPSGQVYRISQTFPEHQLVYRQGYKLFAEPDPGMSVIPKGWTQYFMEEVTNRWNSGVLGKVHMIATAVTAVLATIMTGGLILKAVGFAGGVGALGGLSFAAKSAFTGGLALAATGLVVGGVLYGIGSLNGSAGLKEAGEIVMLAGGVLGAVGIGTSFLLGFPGMVASLVRTLPAIGTLLGGKLIGLTTSVALGVYGAGVGAVVGYKIYEKVWPRVDSFYRSQEAALAKGELGLGGRVLFEAQSFVRSFFGVPVSQRSTFARDIGEAFGVKVGLRWQDAIFIAGLAGAVVGSWGSIVARGTSLVGRTVAVTNARVAGAVTRFGMGSIVSGLNSVIQGAFMLRDGRLVLRILAIPRMIWGIAKLGLGVAILLLTLSLQGWSELGYAIGKGLGYLAQGIAWVNWGLRSAYGKVVELAGSVFNSTRIIEKGGQIVRQSAFARNRLLVEIGKDMKRIEGVWGQNRLESVTGQAFGKLILSPGPQGGIGLWSQTKDFVGAAWNNFALIWRGMTFEGAKSVAMKSIGRVRDLGRITANSWFGKDGVIPGFVRIAKLQLQLVPLGMAAGWMQVNWGSDSSAARVFGYLFSSEFGSLYYVDPKSHLPTGNLLPIEKILMQFLAPAGFTRDGDFSSWQLAHGVIFAGVFYLAQPLMARLGQTEFLGSVGRLADTAGTRLLTRLESLPVFRRSAGVFRGWAKNEMFMSTFQGAVEEAIIEPVATVFLNLATFALAKIAVNGLIGLSSVTMFLFGIPILGEGSEAVAVATVAGLFQKWINPYLAEFSTPGGAVRITGLTTVGDTVLERGQGSAFELVAGTGATLGQVYSARGLSASQAEIELKKLNQTFGLNLQASEAGEVTLSDLSERIQASKPELSEGHLESLLNLGSLRWGEIAVAQGRGVNHVALDIGAIPDIPFTSLGLNTGELPVTLADLALIRGIGYHAFAVLNGYGTLDRVLQALGVENAEDLRLGEGINRERVAGLGRETTLPRAAEILGVDVGLLSRRLLSQVSIFSHLAYSGKDLKTLAQENELSYAVARLAPWTTLAELAEGTGIPAARWAEELGVSESPNLTLYRLDREYGIGRAVKQFGIEIEAPAVEEYRQRLEEESDSVKRLIARGRRLGRSHGKIRSEAGRVALSWQRFEAAVSGSNADEMERAFESVRERARRLEMETDLYQEKRAGARETAARKADQSSAERARRKEERENQREEAFKGGNEPKKAGIKINPKSEEVLKKLGLELVAVDMDVEREGRSEKVTLLRAKPLKGSPGIGSGRSPPERVAEIINRELDEHYIWRGYDADERFGVQQVEAIINLAFRPNTFHRIPAGGGKNDAIFAIAAVISRKVERVRREETNEGKALDELLEQAGVKPSGRMILGFHNKTLFDQMTNDPNVIGYLESRGLKVEVFKEDHLTEIRDNPEAVEALRQRLDKGETGRRDIIQRVEEADIVLADTVGLEFLNNDYRDRRSRKEIEKAVREERKERDVSEKEIESAVEQRVKSGKMTGELWEALFKNNRFVLDEADTSLEANGVQKGANEKKLTAVYVEAPDYVEQAIQEHFSKSGLVGSGRLEAERGLMILTVRYVDDSTERILYRDWKEEKGNGREQSRGGRGTIIDARLLTGTEIPSVAESIAKKYESQELKPEQLVAILSMSEAAFAEYQSSGEWKNLHENVRKEILQFRSTFAVGRGIMQRVAERVSERFRGNREKTYQALTMAQEQFVRERWPSEYGEMLRHTRGSIVGRAMALKQSEREHIALYQEIIADEGHQNDLIQMGEELKEDARIILRTLYKSGVKLEALSELLKKGLLEKEEVEEVFEALGENQLHDNEKALFREHWERLRDKKKLDKIKHFRLVDMVKIVSGNAVAPRLQQSDPYLAAHTQLVFMRYYAEQHPEMFSKAVDPDLLLEQLKEESGRKALLSQVQVSQDSIRSSRNDLIKTIGNGNDLSGFSGTLGGPVQRVLKLTYGVDVIDYIGKDQFFDDDGIRRLYREQIRTHTTLEEALASIRTEREDGARQHLYILSGLKGVEVSRMIAQLKERLLGTSAYDVLIVKTSETGWEKYWIEKGKIKSVPIAFESRKTENVKHFLERHVSENQRAAFFFDRGATRGVDVSATEDAEFASLFNTGSTDFDANQLWSRDRGVRWSQASNPKKNFVYARSPRIAEAFRRGEIPYQVLDLSLQVERGDLTAQEALALTDKKYHQFVGEFTLTSKRNHEVFHPMTIHMVDGQRDQGTPYTDEELIGLLRRNGEIAAQDRLYQRLIDDIDGKLVDFLEELRFKRAKTDDDREILLQLKQRFQNDRGLQYDPNLGGTQSGVDGISGARERVLNFLRTVAGDSRTGVAPMSEFQKLSEEIRNEILEEIRKLEGLEVSLTEKQDPNKPVQGTTEAKRPSDVIDRIRLYVQKKDLPTVAPTGAAKGAEAYRPKTWELTLNEGHGTEKPEADGKAATGGEENRFGKLSQEAEGLLRGEAERRGMFKDGKYTEGANHLVRGVMSVVRGLGATNRSTLQGLEAWALRAGIRIHIPDGDDDEEIVKFVMNLIDHGLVPMSKLNSNLFDLLGQISLTLSLYDSEGRVSRAELIHVMNRPDALAELAELLLVKLDQAKEHSLRKLLWKSTATRLTRKNREEADALREAQFEMRKKELEHELLKMRLEGKGKWSRRFSRENLELGWLKASRWWGENILRGVQKLFKPGDKKTKFRDIRKVIENPAIGHLSKRERIRFALGAVTGDFYYDRDWKMLEDLEGAYRVAGRRLDRFSNERVLLYFRSYRAMRIASRSLGGEKVDEEAIFRAALEIAKRGRVEKLSHSRYRFVRFLEERGSLWDGLSWLFRGWYGKTKLIRQHFRWADHLDSHQQTLTQNDPYLDLVRHSLLTEVGRVKRAMKKVEKLASAKEKAYQEAEKVVLEKQARGEAVTESEQKRLKNALGELEGARYSKEAVEAVLKALGNRPRAARIGEAYKRNAELIGPEGVKNAVQGRIAEISKEMARLEKELETMGEGPEKEALRRRIQSGSRVLKNSQGLLLEIRIVEEGEKADTVAFVGKDENKIDRMHFVRRYLKIAYELYHSGQLGNAGEADRNLAMFLLPYVFHETVEYEIGEEGESGEARIDWGDLGRYVHTSGRDDLGKALRDVLAEAHSTSLIALLGRVNVGAMQRMHRLVGRYHGQTALYTRKAELYGKAAENPDAVFHPDPAVSREAFKPFINYFARTFIDYYFEVINAIEQGNPRLAEEILNSRYVQNRDENGTLKGEHVLSESAYEEAMGYIQRAREAKREERKAIAEEMRRHLDQTMIQMMNLFVARAGEVKTEPTAPGTVILVPEDDKGADKVRSELRQAGVPQGWENWFTGVIREVRNPRSELRIEEVLLLAAGEMGERIGYQGFKEFVVGEAKKGNLRISQPDGKVLTHQLGYTDFRGREPQIVVSAKMINGIMLARGSQGNSRRFEARRLWNVLRDLTVLLRHEQVHALHPELRHHKLESETLAYRETVDVWEKLDLIPWEGESPRYASAIELVESLLAIAKSSEEEVSRPVVELASRILQGEERPVQGVEDLLSRMNARVVAVEDTRFVKVRGVDFVPDLKALRSKVSDLEKHASPEHTVFLLSESVAQSLLDENVTVQEWLRSRSFGVFVYREEEPGTVANLGWIAAWVGVSEFEKMLRSELRVPMKARGYFVVGELLAHTVILGLLRESAIRSAVLIAA